MFYRNSVDTHGRYHEHLTVRGGVDPRKLGFLPRLVEILEIWDDLWTGDGALSCQGGAGSTILIRTTANQRSAGGVGISTLCG